jgi:hypothetical protein
MAFSGRFSMELQAQAGPGVQSGAAARAEGERGEGGRRWWKRAGMAAWLAGVAGFAALHALHLRADFPNHSPWMFDWAKYTDEGWYGNAAVRAHLLGHWHLAGDFNPAVAVPVWPALEWVLFCLTGVTVEAARALAVSVFFVNLALSYALLCARGAGSTSLRREARSAFQWPALLAVSLLVTSPYLYCFSRLAILEPLLTLWVLAGLNVAVRMDRMRRPLWGAAGVGALALLAALTKTTAIFLLPALALAMAVPLWRRRSLALKCVGVASAVFAGGYGLWLVLVWRMHLLADFRYYFYVNRYPRPQEWTWPLVSLWWSAHGVLWVDWILTPLAGVMVVGAAVTWMISAQRVLSPVPKGEGPGAPSGVSKKAGPSTAAAGANSAQGDNAASRFVLSQVSDSRPGAPSRIGTKAGPSTPSVRRGGLRSLRMTGKRELAVDGEVHWARGLLLDPVAGASLLGVAGMIAFMTIQDHPQPRYYAPVAFFLVFLVVRGIEALTARARTAEISMRGWAGAALAVTVIAIGVNGARTIAYAAHPEYTFANAAANLTHYIDTHPNGNRLLVSVSGDEITLLTHLPSLCDDFGTEDLPVKLAHYRPGWFASWNDLDPGTLEDLHTRYSVEQVATFPAFDHPERTRLVLFQLHPLPNGQVRDPHDAGEPDLRQPLPGDVIEVEME